MADSSGQPAGFPIGPIGHLADLDALPAEVPAPTRDRNPRTPPSTISRDQRRNVYRWHHCPFLSIKSPCNSLPL